MDIAGGFYREQCCFPEWNELLGSGGRAAAVVASLSPGSILHTYSENSYDLKFLEGVGVETKCYSRPTAIVFSYFHTLSKPYIQPPLDRIDKQPEIEVSGDVVLRFGFLEGGALVNARRAVFDPQTWIDPIDFRGNGSMAEELAVVLNELEIRNATGIDDIKLAALHVMKHQSAKVVVVKEGVRGATVFESNGRATLIPAYHSDRVFKIGTGDVFSAVFAHYWGEKGASAASAADMASRSVSVYSGSTQLSVGNVSLSGLKPIEYSADGSVLLQGRVDTIGQRYTMEEARFVLRELGVAVSCPILGDGVGGDESVVLIISEGLGEEILDLIIEANKRNNRIVVLNDGNENFNNIDMGAAEVVDDFSSALYITAWAAARD